MERSYLKTVMDKVKGRCDDFAAECTRDEVMITVLIGSVVIGAGFFIVYCL